MTRIALATVSPVSLPDDLARRYGVTVLPTIIHLLDGRVAEGTGISIEELYRRLATDEVLPSTSPIPQHQFLATFEELLRNADAVVVVHISRHSSRMYENAVRAAAQLPDARIINIDSGSLSMGTGLQVLQAARALEAGLSLEDITALLEDLRPRTFICYNPATLRYLRMSNRIGRIPALATSLLGIHPILGMGNDGPCVLERPRSRATALQRMIDLAGEFAGDHPPLELAVVHANALAEARALQLSLQEHFPGVPCHIAEVGAVLAAHIGPGTLGITMIRS